MTPDDRQESSGRQPEEGWPGRFPAQLRRPLRGTTDAMRRWLIVLVGLAFVAAAAVYMRSRPLNVHAADISKLEIDPFPEGPPGPTFTHEPMQGDATFLFDLNLVEPFIPDPLPNTAWQGLNCGMGGNLIVTLLDEDTITYGPCHRPASIDALWAHMLDISSGGACRPTCGPGGTRGP
jgi:hypothetical protein